MATDSQVLRRQQRADFRLVPSGDWRALLRTRANVLVTGPTDVLTAFAEAARSELREPVRSVSGAAPVLVDGPTLMITEVDKLDADGQQRLLRWLNEPGKGDTQVVSLTSAPLYSFVATNRFDATLYYRLNTIRLEIELL